MANKINPDEYELLAFLLDREIKGYEGRLSWYQKNEPKNVDCIKDTSEYIQRLELLRKKLNSAPGGLSE